MVAETLGRLVGKSVRNFLRSSYTRSMEMNRTLPRHSICVKNYNEAIEKLNTLQSNSELINKSTKKNPDERVTHIPDMWRYLSRTGVYYKDLEKLSVIHITGTKGKGSTAAYTDSILRSHGFKTGFYSSPHLILVTERIRLQGIPIDKESFVNYFNRVFQDLHKSREFEDDMPGYFCFLTVLAFNIFLNENVDVAVVEVGIGGLHDFTNVVNNVVTAGITSLGLDHTPILGNTIESIAFQKAGIIKTGCKAFTVEQPKSALTVLEEVAQEKNCQLLQVPELSSYKTVFGRPLNMSIDSKARESNVSLAIQLAHCWMRRNTKEKTDIITELPEETLKGIKSCSWPGRFQKLKCENVDYFLDGAHTKESIDICTEWFIRNLRNDAKKILIFNVTGNRKLHDLVDSLIEIDFDFLIFMPNVAYDIESSKCLDSAFCKSEVRNQMEKCREYMITMKEFLRVRKPELLHKASFIQMESADSTVKLISKLSTEQTSRPQVLVTGSLHLVGVMLTVLDPGPSL